MKISTHLAINISLNLSLIALIIVSFNLSFYQILNTQIYLRSILHSVQIQQTEAIVWTSFQNFNNSACKDPESQDFEIICKHIEQLDMGGLAYILSSSIVILSLFLSSINLSLRLIRSPTFLSKVSLFNYINAGLYVISCIGYIIVTNIQVFSQNKQVSIQVSKGIQLMFLISVCSVFILFHYIACCKSQYIQQHQHQYSEENGAKLNVQNLISQQGKLERELREKQYQLENMQEKFQKKKEKIKVMKENVDFSPDSPKIQTQRSPNPEFQESIKGLQQMVERYRQDSIHHSSMIGLQIQDLNRAIDTLQEQVRNPSLNLEQVLGLICQIRLKCTDLQQPTLQQNWDKERDALNQVINILTQEIQTNSRSQTLKKDVHSLQSLVKDLQIQIQTLQQRNRVLENSQMKAESLRQQTNNLKTLLKAQKERAVQKQLLLQEQEIKLKGFQFQTNTLTAKLQEAQESGQEKEAALERLRKEKGRVVIQLSHTSDELEMVKQSLNRLQKSSQELSEQGSQQYRSLRNEYNILKQRNSKLQELIQTQRQEKFQLSDSCQQLQLTLNELKHKNSLLESNLAKMAEEASVQSLEKLQLANKIDSLNHKIEECLLSAESERNQSARYKERLEELQSAEKQRDEYLERLERTSLSLAKSKTKTANQEQQLENMKQELQILEKQKARTAVLNQRLQEGRMEIERLKLQLIENEEQFEQQKADLIHQTQFHKREVNKLEKELNKKEEFYEEQLKNTYDILTQKNDQLTTLKLKFTLLQNQQSRNQRLQEWVKKELQDKEVSGFQIFAQQLEGLKQALKQTEAQLQSVKLQKQELRREVFQKTQELYHVSQECQNLYNEFYEKKQQTRSFNSHSSSVSSQRTGQDLMILQGVSPVYNQNNPILQQISRLRRQPPMTNNNVFKTFEQLMSEKCKLDKLEMKMGRHPRTMPQYMLDFMSLHYGLKTLALKQLKSLITSLQNLYKIGHPYGTLFCRFLAVHHPRPLPYNVSIYLVTIQELFSQLSTQLTYKPENFAEQYENLQYGGQASIVDVMELVMKACRNHRDIGERIIREMTKLKQESFTEEQERMDLLIVKVCGTMARMGRDSDYIFQILDIDSGGSLDYQQFVDGIRLNLNIWVLQNQVEQLCEYIDQEMTGLISHQKWIEKIDFGYYTSMVNQKQNMVTKSEFLNVMTQEYEYEIVQEYYELRQMIKVSVLSEEIALEFLKQLDPELDQNEAARIYDEAVMADGESTEGVSAEVLCLAVLRNRVGGYGIGIFDVYNLEWSFSRLSTDDQH